MAFTCKLRGPVGAKETALVQGHMPKVPV